MRVFLTVIFLALLAYAIGFVLFVSSLPAVPATPPKTDGIVALTGGDERLDTAVALLEHGVGKRLLVSGVAQETTKETVGKMSEGGPRFACCADIGYAAEDTHGNAEEAAQWARDNHFKSLLIVTGRYHMPRTMREFSSVLPDVALYAYPVDQSRIGLGDWWLHPRTIQLLHREYAKYLASLVIIRLAR
ncbi:MAG TPA: YdcF family protein [Rhizomicrobium sp.]|nr:YdcF family protein [Rhizomicrobium sp.]